MNKSEVISKSICFPNKQHRYRLFLMCSVDHLHLRAWDSTRCDLLFIIRRNDSAATAGKRAAIVRDIHDAAIPEIYVFILRRSYPARNLNEMTPNNEQSVSAAAHLSIQVTAMSPPATLVYLLHNIFMNRWLRLPRSGILCFVTTKRAEGTGARWLPAPCS